METQDMHIAMALLLQDWDPFKLGPDFYEPEIADSIVAVRKLDDIEEIAESIKAIYEFSFEEELNLDECRKMALQLLQIKNNASCTL
ncbi:DUF1871 family protein [Bacillus massiliglaciei]|uniref:DUF1871 family protein n=1 Tax=Bacillus massiliglaciei TaxID=1816693 RepID=UPI000DA5F747|nr:DUF1871 family protein [Bacillus massiliglaciei]